MLTSLRQLRASDLGDVVFPLYTSIDRACQLLHDFDDAKQVTLSVEVDEALQIRSDPDAVLQIVSNLMKNGIQASPNGGTLRITSRQAEGGHELAISDEGPGIPEKIAKRIYSPWVSGAHQGTGLGLAIAKRLTTRLEWQISHSREDGMTVFRLFIPEKRDDHRPSDPGHPQR